MTGYVLVQILLLFTHVDCLALKDDSYLSPYIIKENQLIPFKVCNYGHFTKTTQLYKAFANIELSYAYIYTIFLFTTVKI